MKLLVTNDDGIDAPGLHALEKVLSQIAELVVVAPQEALSGCGHQVNVHRPLGVREVSPGRMAVDGTPADCTRLGLLHIAPDADWVLAGINHGGNLGVDVHMSGTVAAVREGALFGRPGIALSQYRRSGEPVDWEAAGRMTARVIREIWSWPVGPGEFWNVNFPHLGRKQADPSVVFCPVDPTHLPVRFKVVEGGYLYCGVYRDRRRKAGSDVDVCFSGNIAVSRLTGYHGMGG